MAGQALPTGANARARQALPAKAGGQEVARGAILYLVAQASACLLEHP